MAKSAKGRGSDGQTSSGPVDFSGLRREISAGARRSLATAREKSAKENLYAFALYSDDSAMTVCSAANTVEHFERRKAETGTKDKEEVGILQWYFAEWGDYCDSSHHEFATAVAMINGPDRYDATDPNGFVHFKGRVFATMVLALLDLEKEGVFGKGPDRDEITVLCEIPDSWDSAWLERDSARLLNSDTLYKAFYKQWKLLRADEMEFFHPNEDELYLEFTRFLKRGMSMSE